MSGGDVREVSETIPGNSRVVRTLGVVLAGGRGTRLGLGPKALLVLGGETLVARARRTLMTLCDEVVTVAPRGVAERLDVEGVMEDSGEGPLGAMVAAFGSREFERALVLGVDFPLVTGEFLAELLGRLEGHDATMPVVDGVRQPLVACYSGAAAAQLGAAWRAGERSPLAAIAGLDVREEPGVAGLDNVNTLEDWERTRQW